VKHPTDTFILLETPVACAPILYPGSMIRQLAAHGLAAPGACALADWSELEPRLLLNRKAGTSPGPRSRSK